jgi:hypothetical protein
MKRITKIKNYLMPNDLHLQFFTAFLAMVTRYDLIIRKLGILLDTLRTCVEKEEISYKVIRKSDLSELKAESDRRRDDIVAGIKNLLKSLLYHFDENVRKAVRRLKILFDTYDKPTPIINLPYDAETAAINNMIQELEGKYADDVEIAGLTSWLKELAIRNKVFEQLAADHNIELSEKTPFRPKDTRQETDQAYKIIVTALDGLVALEGETEYAPFLSELNTLIKHYNDQVAQHLGHLQAEKEREKEKAKEEEEKKAKEEAEKKDDTKQDETNPNETSK